MCQIDKAVGDFPRGERKCKSCRSEYYREWYRTNGRKRPSNYLEVNAQYRRDNREKWNAKSMVSWALKVGKISKPSECQLCLKTRRLVGHHMDYADQLGVIWLCSSCHKKVHNGAIELEVTT